MKILNNLNAVVSKKLSGYSDRVLSALRERAIEQVKTKIALSAKTIDDFSQDELEFLVRDEEDKIKAKFKGTVGIGLLAFLGLS